MTPPVPEDSQSSVAELREELDLPEQAYRLTLHRLRDGRQWRIAKSAWLGIKPEEEIHLVAVPLPQDDKKPKEEPKPKASPSRPSPTPGQLQPISPRSLANSGSNRTSPSAEPPRSQDQAVVVPATPSDSTISDTEDEAMPLEDAQAKQAITAKSHRNERNDRRSGSGDEEEVEDLGLEHVVPVRHSPSLPPSDSATVLLASFNDPSLPSASQQSTSTISDRRHGRRSLSPSPSYHSERSPSTKARVLRHAPPADSSSRPRAPSSSPRRIKTPPSSFPSASAPLASSSDTFPPPAQQPSLSAGPSGLASSQPSTDSDTSFRIGLDATGEVNFVPASSPQSAARALVQASELDTELGNGVVETMEERRRREKGKGRAIEMDPESVIDEQSDEVGVRLSPRVKRELRSSPRHFEAPTCRISPSGTRFTLEVVSPKKRHPACRIAPRKKRRLSDGGPVAADTSTSTVSSDLSSLSSQTRSQDATRPDLPSALLPEPSPLPASSQLQQSRPTIQRKPRSSISSKRRKPDADAASGPPLPRVEIPPFPSSGRACIYLRLPNAPIAPKWANAGLHPVFILKYQGGTLNVLFHVFQYIARETGWDVRDLRLRYTDTHAATEFERDKVAWGFDSLLTDFQNLDEWKVGEQDFLDVDYIPFSSSRTWMDTE
ncbi:hypothetical protein JCM11491_003800 [Sporobolomyces phaffii]